MSDSGRYWYVQGRLGILYSCILHASCPVGSNVLVAVLASLDVGPSQPFIRSQLIETNGLPLTVLDVRGANQESK